MTVLCLVERDGGEVIDESLRALTFARSLAPAQVRSPAGTPEAAPALVAAVFGPAGPGIAAVLSRYGVTEIYAIKTLIFNGFAPVAWAKVLAELRSKLSATAVVAAGTDRGQEVLAHLGAITGWPMAANCVSAEVAGAGAWRLTRHRWAGSLLEDATLEAPAALLTVAAGAVAAEPAADAAEPAAGAGAQAAEPAAARTHEYEPAVAEADLAVRATESAQRAEGASLATARVVVGGGRGVGGPEGFGALEELAGLLGGVVGVSRVVTSEGWRPHRQQVGQTGTRIAPELYLACGISGAIQHMAGCQGAKHIVAVNTDPAAPIISRADYAVIGDLNQVIPALITALRARPGRS